jgi:hypothetical protein
LPLAVLFDYRLHDVIDRFKKFVIGVRLPADLRRQDIVAGLCLRFGGHRQKQLVALAGDVVDGNLDLLLGSPFIDEFG